jgi:protein gp37
MTIEDQAAADTRLPVLTQIPAAVRFISAEPLFGPLDLSRWSDRLHWVIAGGKSGVHARIGVARWFCDLRDQCVGADIAFLFKQWGEWAPHGRSGARGKVSPAPDGTMMQRVGKKQAGRHLDGEVWDELPKARRIR